MSHIHRLIIDNYRGIKHLDCDFGDETLVILIGRGDSGKSTILNAIHAVLSPSWNMTFNDLDFHNQDLSKPITIEAIVSGLPQEILKESKFGLYTLPLDDNDFNPSRLCLRIILTVTDTLEPHWCVRVDADGQIPDKPISANDRALLSVNLIGDYSDNQFAYNRQSPLYSLTKKSLEEGQSIEVVKSKLLRAINETADKKHLAPLNLPLSDLRERAILLGLSISEIEAQIDIKENPYTGNSIALHDGGLPFRLRGKGSKRLMSIAIQTELTKSGGIVLVDEIEQGLEPDRIITLLSILKNTGEGQVFLTTHSIHVIIEACWNNLFILSNSRNEINLYKCPSDLESCRRLNPHAFFAKRLICCEGKTELGIVRAFNRIIQDADHENFSSLGISMINCNGGDQMYTIAKKMKNLGYDVCVFADDDIPKELKRKKQAATEAEIPLFLCDEGNCIEAQIIQDLPWNALFDLINCPQTDFPSHNIVVDEQIETAVSSAEPTPEESKRIRTRLVELSIDKDSEGKLDKKGRAVKKKEWFKHIPGGKFLGELIIKHWEQLKFSTTRQNLEKLKNWALHNANRLD